MASLTPWSIDAYGSLLDASGRMVSVNGVSSVCSPGAAQDQARVNTALIALAVNSYDADQAKIAALTEALKRIKAATPRSTNSISAQEMSTWCKAVAATALDGETP